MKQFKLTEAHATKALKNCQYNYPTDLSLTFDSEGNKHDD